MVYVLVLLENLMNKVLDDSGDLFYCCLFLYGVLVSLIWEFLVF